MRRPAQDVALLAGNFFDFEAEPYPDRFLFRFFFFFSSGKFGEGETGAVRERALRMSFSKANSSEWGFHMCAF